MVRDTSKESFKAGKVQFISVEGQILKWLMRRKKSCFTRREISVLMGIEYGSVCGRVNSLLEKKMLVEPVKKVLASTGRMAYVVQVAA